MLKCVTLKSLKWLFDVRWANILLCGAHHIRVHSQILRVKASVHPRVSYDGVIHLIVKGGIFEFICHGRTKNGILFCESLQNWCECIEIYNTQMPLVNVTKKLQWEGI